MLVLFLLVLRFCLCFWRHSSPCLRNARVVRRQNIRLSWKSGFRPRIFGGMIFLPALPRQTADAAAALSNMREVGGPELRGVPRPRLLQPSSATNERHARSGCQQSPRAGTRSRMCGRFPRLGLARDPALPAVGVRSSGRVATGWGSAGVEAATRAASTWPAPGKALQERWSLCCARSFREIGGRSSLRPVCARDRSRILGPSRAAELANFLRAQPESSSSAMLGRLPAAWAGSRARMFSGARRAITSCTTCRARCCSLHLHRNTALTSPTLGSCRTVSPCNGGGGGVQHHESRQVGRLDGGPGHNGGPERMQRAACRVAATAAGKGRRPERAVLGRVPC